VYGLAQKAAFGIDSNVEPVVDRRYERHQFKETPLVPKRREIFEVLVTFVVVCHVRIPWRAAAMLPP